MPSNNNVTASLRLLGGNKFSTGMKGAERDTSRLGSGFGKMGHAAKLGFAAVGVGAAAGIAVLTKSVAEGFTSLQRIDRIHRQSVAAIKATGGAAGVTAQQMEDLGGAIEATTASEQETTQMGQNMLLTFTNIKNGVGKGNDIFNQATLAMVDMGRAMDKTGDPLIDLNKTAIQLGKALNDPIKGVTALSKVGVSFDAQQKKQIKTYVEHGQTVKAQKLILNELNKEFGGSAKAFGNSYTGRIERVKHAYGTMQETVASALLPALEKTTDWALTKGIPLMEKFGAWALPRIQQGFAKVSPYVQRFVAAARPLAKSFAGGEISQARKGIDSLRASLQRNSPWLKATGQDIKEGIVKYGPTAAKYLGLFAAMNFRELVTGIGFAVDAVRILGTGFVQISRAAINAFGVILHGATKALGWVPGIGDKLKGADEAFGRFATSANEKLDSIEKTLNLNINTTDALNKLTEVKRQAGPILSAFLPTTSVPEAVANPVRVRAGRRAAAAATAPAPRSLTLNSYVVLDGKVAGKSTRRDAARVAVRR